MTTEEYQVLIGVFTTVVLAAFCFGCFMDSFTGQTKQARLESGFKSALLLALVVLRILFLTP